MGFEPSTSTFERLYYITSTIEPIDTRGPHRRTIYFHKDISTAIYAIRGSLRLLGLGGFFTHLGILSYCIKETRGRVRSWRDSLFTISSNIERFTKKCSLRSTAQAGPILFYQVKGRLPRYVMLKYF